MVGIAVKTSTLTDEWYALTPDPEGYVAVRIVPYLNSSFLTIVATISRLFVSFP
jgi:hypothetical protein